MFSFFTTVINFVSSIITTLYSFITNYISPIFSKIAGCGSFVSSLSSCIPFGLGWILLFAFFAIVGEWAFRHLP